MVDEISMVHICTKLYIILSDHPLNSPFWQLVLAISRISVYTNCCAFQNNGPSSWYIIFRELIQAYLLNCNNCASSFSAWEGVSNLTHNCTFPRCRSVQLSRKMAISLITWVCMGEGSLVRCRCTPLAWSHIPVRDGRISETRVTLLPWLVDTWWSVSLGRQVSSIWGF